MDFNEKYNAYLKIINDAIEDYFGDMGDMSQKVVFDAMKYAICGGGKRLRPVMTLAAAEMTGADLCDAARVALAVECVHNYSLIHDDLPCMDDDDLRRGRATCHIVYGEDIALLAGDGLLNSAFEILSDETKFKKLGGTELLHIVRCLADASGVFGMIGGQVIDLKAENRNDVSIGELNELHANKTGKLIRAAVKCGILCSGGALSDTDAEVMDKYAENLGMAFQIKDDILDVEGDETLLGKPIGSDAVCGKNTFVTLLGIDGAKERIEACTDEAKNVLGQLGDRAEFFLHLAESLLKRKF